MSKCGAIIYGYRCDIEDIVIPPYVYIGGRRVSTEDMSPQEYCEYTKWFEYCNFSDDDDFIIGICVSYGNEVAGIDAMRQAMDGSSDVIDAVYDLTKKTISIDDLGFCCTVVSW